MIAARERLSGEGVKQALRLVGDDASLVRDGLCGLRVREERKCNIELFRGC